MRRGVAGAGVAAAALVCGACGGNAPEPVRAAADVPLIAFERTGDQPTAVFVVAPDGRLLRPVRHPAGTGFDYDEPAWSPDGRRLAYAGVHPGEPGPRIYVLRLLGRSVPRAVASGLAPSWSADGAEIRYEDASGRLFVVAASGPGRPRPIGDRLPKEGVAWSPDGARVAFVRQGDVYVMGVDGTGLRRLTADPAEERDPAWSPDGTLVAFKVKRAGDATAIEVIGLDGRGRRVVARGVSFYQSLAWSPDGDRIAFTSRNGGIEPISVVNLDGSGRRRLTPGPTDVDAAWSPDGKWVAFAGYRGDDGYDLFVIRDDRAGLRRLTRGPDYERRPIWQPGR